jgi:hypothetical protein
MQQMSGQIGTQSLVETYPRDLGPVKARMTPRTTDLGQTSVTRTTLCMISHSRACHCQHTQLREDSANWEEHLMQVPLDSERLQSAAAKEIDAHLCNGGNRQGCVG